MQTSQGYIFRVSQHFVTKFCNFTNFNMFFTGIYFFCLDQKLAKCKLSIKPRFQTYILVYTKLKPRHGRTQALSELKRKHAADDNLIF